MKLKEKKLVLYYSEKIKFIPYSLTIMKENFKDIALSFDIKTEIIKNEIE